MCLSPSAHVDSMQSSNTASMSKPPIPKCDNMNKISEEMDAFRATQMSNRRTTNEYLMLCLIGFGSIDRRDALMRVIAWALEPILLYSAFIKEIATQEFEAVMITKKQVSATAVEDWLGLFNMGICCIQFDSYMQPDMVTCISRIHHMGKHWFGSFKARSSARVRRDFYKEHMKELKAKEHQRLLEVTGLTLTTRNMLTLHDRVNNLQSHVAYLERQIRDRGTGPREDNSSENPDAATLALVSRFAESAGRVNLASAYRRMQANGEVPVSGNVRPVGPVEVDIPPPPPPVTVDLTSRPASPEFTPTNPIRNAPPQGIAFITRQPPTGHVTVFLVRE